MKLQSPAAERNAQPILDVLRRVLPASGTLLEIASGGGYHAMTFASALPALDWQPSDPSPEARASIDAFRQEAQLPNVLPPLALDVRDATWGIEAADAMLCINMIHISPWESCQGLFRGAAALLPAGAPLVTYGPYRVAGEAFAPSNASFDASLRSRNPAWGIRSLAKVCDEAASRGIAFEERVDMPANNLALVFRKQ